MSKTKKKKKAHRMAYKISEQIMEIAKMTKEAKTKKKKIS